MQLKFNASMGTWSDPVKMQFCISRQAHTLEKGKSLRQSREGFGKGKAALLEQEISRYRRLYGASPEVEAAASILEAWRSDQDSLIVPLKAQTIKNAAKGDFDTLTSSRHSIRMFSSTGIKRSEVEEALEIASRTPSACNRQAWHSHIYSGQEAQDILKWQEGAKGFEKEIPMIIVVTCDLRGFLSYEVHQAWIDGGLYAMNLLNALHYKGFGTIPLSCGFHYRKLKELHRHGITDSQIPIMIIGFGNMEDCCAAVSGRKDIGQTNTWHV